MQRGAAQVVSSWQPEARGLKPRPNFLSKMRVYLMGEEFKKGTRILLMEDKGKRGMGG